jgi:hypothetical protein
VGPRALGQHELARASAGGVTSRAILVAFLLLVAIALLNFHVEILRGLTWTGAGVSSGVPTILPVVFLLLLAAAMGLPLLRRAGLSRRELLAVYCLVLVGAPVLTHAVLVWMLVKNVAYYYTARVQPYWEVMFLKHVPPWWAPSDAAAVVDFFEGQAPVPWGLWRVPLLAWGSFLTALFLCNLCLMSLVQRQWVTNERLTFPFAQIPLEMVRSGEAARGEAPGRLSLSPLFSLGLLISFGLNLMGSLAERIPALPRFSLFLYDVIPWQRVGPLAGVGGITLCFWPWMIALAYLIPKDLSFSVWFFSILRFALTVAAIAAGATPLRPEDWWSTSFPAPYYQGGGAVLALSIWVLWIARRHLGRAARALASWRSVGDADEPLSYRWAFIGLALSYAFMVYFFWASNCRVLFGVVLVAVTLGYFGMWARLRAETGVGFLAFPIQIQDVSMIPFGSQSFRVSELVALVTMRWAYTPGFSVSSEVFPGAALEAFKIADAARLRARRLAPAMVAGFLLSLVVGIAIFMRGVYQYGWFGLAVSRGGWLGPQSINDGARIVSFLTDPSVSKPDLNGIIALLAGAAVVIILGTMRLRFWWWPFHPVGYIASNTWGFHWWCLPFFIGWVGKTLAVRYGGLRLYRATVPLAVGLIVGDLLNGGLWIAVKVVTAGRV